ncbi:MAG: hypothetical protein ABI234_05270 [Ktedonobacteraceae bacterium]
MLLNEPEKHLNDVISGYKQQPDASFQYTQPQYLMPASIQLENIFVIEVMAKKYPVEIPSDTFIVASKIRIEEVQLAPDNIHAQAILSVQVEFDKEPRPFEISFKLIGLFAYTQNMTTDAIAQFLRQGSLSVMLPFARELLMNLCMRLQVPPIMLQMIQIVVPSSSAENGKEDV